MSAFLWVVTMAACGWLMVRQMLKWRKESVPAGASGYEKKQEAGGWRFNVTPNQDTMKYRGAQALVFIVAIVVGIQLFFASLVLITGSIDKEGAPSEDTSWTVFWIILPLFAVWTACAARRFLRRASNKIIASRPSTFLVDSESITIDGKRFHKGEIARLTKRNIISESEYSSPNTTVVSTQNLSSAAAGTFASMQSSANAYKRERMRLIAFNVQFESGGNAHFLATALNESQAYGLMKEVGDILGFTVA